MITRPDTFMRREWPFVEGLEPWLDKATHGLCAEAVERVCREVVEHCKASIEAKLAAGMPMTEVDRAVMAELGSWRAARRAFRRSNLTYHEDLRLQAIVKKQSLTQGASVVVSMASGLGALEIVKLNMGIPLGDVFTVLPILVFGITPQWAIPLLQHLMGLHDSRRLIRGFTAVQCVIVGLTLPWLLISARFNVLHHVPFGIWLEILLLAIPVLFMCYLPYLTWTLQYKLPCDEEVAKP